MRSNPIRFTGMASGMDTDSIVRDMMKPQQYKIDQEKKAQALVKLRQDAWKEMNTKLYDFHTKHTDKMRLGSGFNQNQVTSSNPDAVSIDKDANVPAGTHTFEVTQLATSTTVVGKVASGAKSSVKLSELLGGEELPARLSMKVNNTWVDIDIGENDTLASLVTNLNKGLKDKGTGFRANYDEKNASFFIASTATGVDQTIAFSERVDKGREIFKALGLYDGNKSQGQDAKYSYNGAPGFTSATNAIEVNGIKATLRSQTTEPVTISAEPSTEIIYDFIKDYITEYNKLIEEVNEKLDTKPGKDIMPLTAEERDAMSETDIKLWEEKLNSSLFYRDSSLTEFAETARRTLSDTLTGGKYNSLASLGIVTGTWQEKGKLYIVGDEDSGSLYSTKPNQLKAAIEENPGEVTDFFKAIGSKLYKAHNDVFRSGNRLKSAMNFYNDKVMTDQVKNFDKRIAALEERMYKMEDIQYRKFAAMEKMLSTLNNQRDRKSVV